MAASEGLRWIRAAESDLDAVEALLEAGHYHLGAFHAHQVAEKALKGMLRLHGRVPWGHNCLNLLKEVAGLLTDLDVPEELFAATRRLDRHYIPSRYPDAFPAGIPADHYDRPVAKQAQDDAVAMLRFVQDNMP